VRQRSSEGIVSRHARKMQTAAHGRNFGRRAMDKSAEAREKKSTDEISVRGGAFSSGRGGRGWRGGARGHASASMAAFDPVE
jgi:hypothetical protein